MRNLLPFVMLATFLLLSVAEASAQDGAAAPLPVAVTSAKTIFVSGDDANSSVAYQAFCEGMRDWGKYEIVASRDEADLIIELGYIDSRKRSAYWSGRTFVSTQPRAQREDSQVVVTFYDSRSDEPLWSLSEPQKREKRKKSREREAIQSVQHLIGDLKLRAIAPE